MLVSISLGIFILCVIYVAYWSVKNDALGSIEEQVGFIRMRVPKKPASRPTASDTARAVGRNVKPPRR